MNKIFISYRRRDSVYISGFIFSRLANRYGVENVFRDTNSIQVADSFLPVIQQASLDCQVMLLLIGDRWLSLTDNSGRRRIDIDNDVHRREIETGLQRNIPIIIALLEDVSHLNRNDLPSSIADIADKQALRIRPDEDLENDLTRLEKVIDYYLGRDINIRDEATTSINITIMKSYGDTPSPLLGEKIQEEIMAGRLKAIATLFAMEPNQAEISSDTLTSYIAFLGEHENGLSIKFNPRYSNHPPLLTLSLEDIQNRLTMGSEWNLNLTRFARRRENLLDLFHNGDNSLPSPYREGSYGKNAPYSITKFASDRFPELRCDSEDFVYLGSLPLEKNITMMDFAMTRHRLALYDYSRWLWLRDHPRRQEH